MKNWKNFNELLASPTKQETQFQQSQTQKDKGGEELLKDIMALKYPEFVKQLHTYTKNDNIWNKLKIAIESAEYDKNKIEFSNPKGYAVKSLISSQNEVDMDQSLWFTLSGEYIKLGYKEQLKNILKSNETNPTTIVGPIIILNGKYIIDGHHRWSSLYSLNKGGYITAISMEVEVKYVETILKAVQLSIASLIKKVPTSEARGINLFSIDEGTLKNYVISGKGSKYGNFEGIIDEVLNTITLIKPEIKTSEDVADFIWLNILDLKSTQKNYKNKPKRDFMPQTDQAKGWEKSLQQGNIKFLVQNEHIIKYNDFLKIKK